MIAAAWLALAPAAAPQGFNIGANFQTVTGGNGSGSEAGVTPPDTQGAAGVDQIGILVNGRYKVFSKTGAQQQNLSQTTFFSNAGAGSGSAGDPRILFDPLSGRWFAVNFTSGNNNNLLVAISAGADPTGQWKSIVIPTSGGTFKDFPTLGLDANGLYIGTNNFSGSFTGIGLYTIPKTSLLWSGAGSPSLTNLTSNNALSANTFGTTPQQIVNFDVNQSGNTTRVIANWDNNDFRTFTINNTTGTTTLSGATSVGTNSIMNQPPDANQPSGSANVSTGDYRVSANAVRVGDLVYFVNGVDSGGRASVRYNVMNVNTNTLVQQGIISDPNLGLYFPSIAVNELGEAVIAFSGSSSTQFISTYAVVSTTAGGLNFGPVTQLSAGLGNYQGFDGAPYRWGDYSATSVDPADTGIFWAFQERASSVLQNWATQATEIIPNRAGQVRWQAAASGNYASASSWFNGAVPGAGSHVIYSRNGNPFTVTLPAGTTNNDQISVRQGTATFNIPVGATYAATNPGASTPSFAVSQFLGNTDLTITGGGTLSTVNTWLAAGTNGLVTNNVSKATVRVNGANWNNSGDVHFGGSNVRSGGTASLVVSNGGAVDIEGSARFWTSSSGVTLTGGAAGATLSAGGLRSAPGVAPTIGSTGTNAVLNVTDGLAQTFFGNIAGTLSLNKTGPGTQSLAGVLSYSGDTTVSGGVLEIAPTGSYTGTGSFNVAGGALRVNGQSGAAAAVTVAAYGTLSGSGTVNGATTITGGVISPGQSPGNLTFAGGLTMNAGTYLWQLDSLTTAGPGTNYDLITIAGGTTTIDAASQLTLDFSGLGPSANPNGVDAFWQSNHQWMIVDWTGAGSFSGNIGSITNANWNQGFFALSGGNGDFFLNFSFSPVPEPGTLALLAAAAACAWRRRSKARGSVT
ncbi:MAG TPA: autotransporter-associated beta strand repeat-containing protein [Planctomycetia bacterium]|nr:autotransporter-associated beta strand repeat-containing protein [Planctomycetia bacterium]